MGVSGRVRGILLRRSVSKRACLWFGVLAMGTGVDGGHGSSLNTIPHLLAVSGFSLE